MLNTSQPIHYTGKAHQPTMINFIKKINQLFSKIVRLRTVAPNKFHNRYHEKSINPDHCQWQGGRLLSKEELDKFNTRQKINKEL